MVAQLPNENAIKHKFEENIHIELKNGQDSEMLSAFQKVTHILDSEGSYYSLNRESFIKFFNELTNVQQKEFLSLISSPENSAKNIYDLAQEYNARIMQKK